jgi:hypothetical protein
MCFLWSASDPDRARRLMFERAWESVAGASGGHAAETEATTVDNPSVSQDAGGGPAADTGVDGIAPIDRFVPLVRPDPQPVVEFVLPVNADPTMPETYVVRPSGAVSDDLAVLGDRIALSGVGDNSMLAGALYTGASRQVYGNKVMKVAPAGSSLCSESSAMM